MTTHIQTANVLQAADNSLQKAFAERSAQSNQLSKDDFLKLLMAQVTHQDPLNPMDSQGMMEQLTGMGSLEQLININDNLANLNSGQTDIVRANAYSYLNKDVTVRGGGVNVLQGQAPGLQYRIPREAGVVKVNIIDQQGEAVRSLDLGAQAPGHHTVDWDGKNSQGQKVPDGSYRYSVTAKGVDNEPLSVDLFRQAKVSGVRFENGTPKLKIGDEDITLSDVIEMSNRSERIFGDRLPATLRQDIRTRPPMTKPRP